jgi:hypothetical protein
MLKALDAKKADVDKALAEGAVGEEADAIMQDLYDEDARLVVELKDWCREGMDTAIADAASEAIRIFEIDFGPILATAEQLYDRATLLADWAQDEPLDSTGGEMIADLAMDWVVFEIALTARGIGRADNQCCGGEDAQLAATRCLTDLIKAVRRGGAARWFVYLPIFGDELLALVPNPQMGMSHAAFAKRLGVAVELLRRVQPDLPGKGKPGRRGFSGEMMDYALKLREQRPGMKAEAILAACRERFPEEDLPIDGNSLRACMSRRRRNNRT